MFGGYERPVLVIEPARRQHEGTGRKTKRVVGLFVGWRDLPHHITRRHKIACETVVGAVPLERQSLQNDRELALEAKIAANELFYFQPIILGNRA